MSAPWIPGAHLHVVATGDEVHPFAGTLRTPAPWSGVMPPIGPAPVAIDLAQDFVVSWIPDGQSNESVILTLDQIRSDALVSCTCTVPDASAQVTVDHSLLGLFETHQLSSSIGLSRTITSTTSSDNATIDLIGEVVERADATFH
jgi:hypothetical protein